MNVCTALTKSQRSVINRRAADLALQITPEIRALLVLRVIEEFGQHGARAASSAELIATLASVTPKDVAEHLQQGALR